VGSNPTPRTIYVKNAGGFVMAMLSVFRLSEDFSSIMVFAGYIFEAGLY
jgi:hypothetical protein